MTPRVLNVDDDAASRYAKTRHLAAAGMHVVEATDGAALLRLLDAEPHAVIVLDVQMPEMDGLEACRRIRADPVHALRPVLLISATFVKEADRVRAMEAGADVYLTVPIDPFVLVASVRSLHRMFAAELTARAAAEERARALALQEAARARAEEANQLKDDFLATLSHELRTPLSAIVGWARILRERGSDPAMLQRGLDVIARNVDVQRHLVDELLDVSRIAAGKVTIRHDVVDFAAVVHASVDAVRPAAATKGVALQHAIGAARVPGDAERLQQVATNLLGNAVKFTPAGGHVRVTVEHAGPEVVLTVADDGPGIAPSFLPHVFDRFRQADASTTRSHGGLGLGLAIARHLTELHGGEVAVESGGTGQGATFRVTLPATDAAASA